MKRGGVSRLVRDFRLAIGETQQQFAQTMGTAITTIARYETSRAPSGKALIQLANAARIARRRDFYKLFVEAFADEVELALPNVRFTARLMSEKNERKS